MKRLQCWIRHLATLAVLSLCCTAAQAEHYTLPLLAPADASGGPQGLLRILNATEESGTVEIYAIDDAGTRSGPATFTLNASSAAEFTATDLQSGNATLGLTGGIGTEVGDARLEIETDLQIVPLAFVRAADGTLSAMHDTVRGVMTDDTGQSVYEVPVFNPSTEMTHVSRLRLINPGDEAAAVTIAGLGDNGAEASGGDVSLSLAAGGAKTLTAQQLEAGDESVTGQLGAGTGKWRLTVSSDQPLEVVNIVASSAGYWNNLSTTAVPGSAPADLSALNERLVGKSVVYRAQDDVATLNVAAGERFTETVESDGVTATHTGDYDYAGIGPDAGRLTLAYDDGDECVANLYFASRTSGWFASHCTGSDYPAEGTWLGGNWSVADEEDDDGDGTVTETTYGVDEALPGVPTSGFFIPARQGGGIRVSASAAGTTISLDRGGYFELNDGTRYTCAATGGCTVVNGVVSAGTVTERAAGTGEVDRFPSFRTADRPGNRSYTVGTAIDTLTLPEASSGNGALSYSLSPTVPGLTFDASTRQLSGTPSTAGTYTMTYTVADEDGDTDSLGFTITVSADTPAEGSLGVCQVGMTLSSGQSCTYPGTADEFSVNARGRGRFLTFLAGIRIRINNQTINGRVYDFVASHLGDGVWRIDRIAGSTEPATDGGAGTGTGTGDTGTDTSPSFADGSGPGNQTYAVGTAIDTLTLPEAGGGDGSLSYSLSPNVPGLTFNATTRQLTGTPTAADSYSMTYTATDEDGDTDTLTFTVTVTEPDPVPDLVVESVSVSDSSPESGASFTLRATVRNRGDGQSGATTLRYYRSSNETISMSDTAVGTDSVNGLSASDTSAESISLTAPSSAGTYYYGACVDSVAGESDTNNNCSASVAVTVTSGTGATYTTGNTLPGVPTTGFFLPAITSGGSVSSGSSGTTITLRNGGYIELNDGTRYTCTSSDGCSIENGAVTRGTVVGGTPGSGYTAPADEAAFNSRAVGNRFHGPDYYVDFPSAGRFLEDGRLPGNYSYANTGSDSGTLTQTFDDSGQYGGSCTVRLTFVTETSGTLSYSCASRISGQGSWTITASDVPPAPRVVRNSATNTSIRFGFRDSFNAGETKAFDIQGRRKMPQSSWDSACLTASNNSADSATGTVGFSLSNLQPGTVYEARYRFRNSSSCDAGSGSPGPWSLIGEGTTTGAAQGLSFSENAPATRSIPENLPGGINVGVPVSAEGSDALTYSIGGVDAGSFVIVPETGQIRTLDNVSYDYETKNRYQVEIEVADDIGNRESIDVAIDLRDLGPN